ncbi:segregation and condensation protein A [Zymobacter palmae]
MSETMPSTSAEEASNALSDRPDPAAIARIEGKPVIELPQDLYIPPEALRVFLDTFEGPLDLLLYLIRRHNLDILAINVAAVTHQYIAYVELMKASGIDLAAEYLLMAAMLAEIKSRSLLPRQKSDDDEEGEDDPTAQLIERLQAYEQLKQSAAALDELPRYGRDWFSPQPALPEIPPRVVYPEVALEEMLSAFGQLMARASMNERHQVTREALSTRERMTMIMTRLSSEQFTPFEALFTLEEGRAGVVVTFMALLELAKERLIEIVQNEPLSPLHVRARTAASDESPFADDEREIEEESAFEAAPPDTFQ